MIITVRKKWIIKFFWRHELDGRPRRLWPTQVTADHKIWIDWFLQKYFSKGS